MWTSSHSWTRWAACLWQSCDQTARHVLAAGAHLTTCVVDMQSFHRAADMPAAQLELSDSPAAATPDCQGVATAGCLHLIPALEYSIFRTLTVENCCWCWTRAPALVLLPAYSGESKLSGRGNMLTATPATGHAYPMLVLTPMCNPSGLRLLPLCSC